MKKGESLKNQIKKKQDDALEVKPAAPKDYWTVCDIRWERYTKWRQSFRLCLSSP